MPFIHYKPEERMRMAEIYAECGGNGSVILTAVRRIRNELWIELPEEGRSLRNWQKRYGIYPKVKEAEPVLFKETQREQSVIVLPRLMPMEEFEEKLQEYAGEAKDKDDILLQNIYLELQSGRLKESLKGKSMEELLQIKRLIEESQQKRESHMIKLMEYVDFKRKSIPIDYNKYDNEILGDLDGVMDEKVDE
jgi:hypothetical protein